MSFSNARLSPVPMASISLYSISIFGSIPSEPFRSGILLHHHEMTQFVCGSQSNRAPSELNPYPTSPQRIIQDHSRQESHTHIPHCKGCYDEHNIEVGFFISDVFYHYSQFRTRE